MHDTLNAYAISEGGSEEHSAFVIVVDKGADDTGVAGTRIKVTGTYIEFYYDRDQRLKCRGVGHPSSRPDPHTRR